MNRKSDTFHIALSLKPFSCKFSFTQLAYNINTFLFDWDFQKLYNRKLSLYYNVCFDENEIYKILNWTEVFRSTLQDYFSIFEVGWLSKSIKIIFRQGFC